MRIAVLAGGKSSEREVSLKTGSGVAAALKESGHEVRVFDVVRELSQQLLEFMPELVFIALHGKFGEDGTVQGMLEILEIPYTGSGILASALAMDKHMAKEVFVYNGIPTPEWLFVEGGNDVEGMAAQVAAFSEKYGFPLVVKPCTDGSSCGMTIVHKKEEIAEALEKAVKSDRRVLVERFVAGREITVALLGNGSPEALEPIEIVAKNAFYDYESKYVPGMSEHIIPARITASDRMLVMHLAKKAHEALGCRGYSRVDFLLPEDGKVVVLEVNTLPGMTPTSLIPDAAAFAGMSYKELTQRIVELALTGTR